MYVPKQLIEPTIKNRGPSTGLGGRCPRSMRRRIVYSRLSAGRFPSRYDSCCSRYRLRVDKTRPTLEDATPCQRRRNSTLHTARRTPLDDTRYSCNGLARDPARDLPARACRDVVLCSVCKFASLPCRERDNPSSLCSLFVLLFVFCSCCGIVWGPFVVY